MFVSSTLQPLQPTNSQLTCLCNLEEGGGGGRKTIAWPNGKEKHKLFSLRSGRSVCSHTESNTLFLCQHCEFRDFQLIYIIIIRIYKHMTSGCPTLSVNWLHLCDTCSVNNTHTFIQQWHTEDHLPQWQDPGCTLSVALELQGHQSLPEPLLQTETQMQLCYF